MHYYQHHIGDLIKDTANLNDHQLATYLRMLWSYYSEEKPLTNELEDLAFAMRSDEKTVRLLLRHYFKECSDGWRHSRCDREIAEFHGKKDKAAASANARWKNTKNKPSAMRTQCERNANASVLDANQEPITNNQEEDQETCATATHAAPVDDLFAKFWSLYPSKKDKAKAAKAFAKLKITDDLFNQIISGLAAQVASHDWTKDGGKYIPMPTTWLNGKRWEDEVKPSSNVHSFPGQSRHHGLAERFVAEGVREDGTHAF